MPPNSRSTRSSSSETDNLSLVVLTPQSASISPSTPTNPPLGPDNPIPTIERSDSSVSSPRVAINTNTPSTPRQSSVGDIDHGIQNLFIFRGSSSPSSEPLDLSNLAAALSTSSPTPTRFLQPQGGSNSPEPPSPDNGRRSRRSSSRLNHAPHDIRDEEPPVDRFHDPAFQTAFNEARRLLGSLTRVLGSSDVHLEPDSTMKDLHQTASRLAEFQCPPTRVVGLVGDSGVGMGFFLVSACGNV